MLIQNKNESPSEDWHSFSDSNFSLRHVLSENKKIRTSTELHTATNIGKLCIGITTISLSKSLAQTGFYASIIGLTYVTVTNIYCAWILLQARNRYKRSVIVDLPDLAAKIFGENYRVYTTISLITCSLTYCVAYNIFFGQQLDQLQCKYFKYSSCGKESILAFSMNVILLPLFMLKSLKNIGNANFFIMSLTVICLSVIMYFCIKLYMDPIQQINEEYGLKITPQDRNYQMWNPSYLPEFIAIWMNVLEGSQNFLNLYAEHDNPKSYIRIIFIMIIIVTIFDILVSVMGYLAFGNQVQDVILYNLPFNSPLSISIKILYIICISGSFILIIQPIYHIMESSSLYKSISGAQDAQNNENFPISVEQQPIQDSNQSGYQYLRQSFVYVGFRMMILFLVLMGSFIIPDINFLLIVCGSIFGTIITYIMPVMFYNKAYSNSVRNMNLDRGQNKNDSLQEEKSPLFINQDQDQLIIKEVNDQIDKLYQQKNDDQLDYEDSLQNNDKRGKIRILNWIVMVSGVLIGGTGLVNALQSLK